MKPCAKKPSEEALHAWMLVKTTKDAIQWHRIYTDWVPEEILNDEKKFEALYQAHIKDERNKWSDMDKLYLASKL